MHRFNRNLSVAIAVVGITLFGSLAFAHGAGGGGDHAGGSNRGAGASFSRGTASPTHTFSTVQSRGNVRSFARVTPPNHPGVPPILPPRRHPWPPYHMHYPVRFWFGGNFDVAEVVEGGIDVEFTSIRQLDAGDSSKNLAPAYRVWFHNNSDVDINQPFDVAILGSNDQTLTTNLPFAAVRVDGMGAGETMSVDIRLPIEAMSMATVDGKPAAYTFLHTIIDSENELVETNKANNLALFARTDIPMLGQ